jgi:hypothetical protein
VIGRNKSSHHSVYLIFLYSIARRVGRSILRNYRRKRRMRLVDLINNQIVISEEAYLLKPFKSLWDRDKSKDKERVLSELGYIYYMEDFKSDFSDITNEKERGVEVVNSLNLSKGWKEDKFVKEAREFYRKRSEEITPLLFLRDVKVAIDRMREQFREVDFLAVDKNGKSKYDIEKFARVIEKSANLLENLTKLENMVKKEVQSKKDKVGSKSKSMFEEGID